MISNNAPSYTVYDTSVKVNQNPELPCYKIQAVDSCGNYGSFYEEHCPVNLRGKNGNLRNTLYWRNYVGFGYDSFFVYRNDINGVYVRYATRKTNDTTFVDSNLICNQTYTYILRYVNFSYDSLIYSESDTVQLTPYDTVAPNAPKVHLVTVYNDSKVNLSFYPSTSKDVNNYDIYRITNGGAAAKIATLNYPSLSSGLVVYTDTSLSCLTDRYCYYVIARDSCSNLSSPPSNVHCDVQLKGSPGNNRCYINWMKYTGRGIEYYNLKKYTSSGWVNLNSLGGSDSVYTDSVGITCGANIYQIQAVDSSGTILSNSDTLWVYPVDTVAPIGITIKKVTVLNQSSIYLHWTRSSTDINRYILYRSVNNNSPQPYDTLSASDTSFIDNGLDCINNFYSYSIEARDSCKDASSGLAAVHHSMNLSKKMDFCQKKLDLYWNKYINWVNGVASYEVLRSVNGGSYVSMVTLTAADSHYLDTVSYGRLYSYKIRANESNGNFESSISDTVSFYFRPVKGPLLNVVSKTSTSSTNGTIRITFDVLYYDSLVKYARLYHSNTGAAGSYTLLKDSIPVGQTYFDHTNINTSSSDHYYYMVNRDTCGNFTDSNGFHKTMDLTVVQKKIRNRLYWTPYKGFAVKNYLIERIDTNVNFALINTISGNDTFYIDYPSPCNGYVKYRISAVDSAGNYISYSDTVTLFPIDTVAKDSGAIYNVTVLDDKTILVEFYSKDSSDIYGYTVKHSLNNGLFYQSKFYFFNSYGYQYMHIDSVNTLQDEHSYILYTVDSCLNTTPSPIFKAIQLRGYNGHLKNTIYFNKFEGY
ncbi:MAG: hypothetical protein HYZ42_13860, partial [Bacteroidetes bacterium]|nr:hypothetical protein [Bacteroidota bacterium]